MAQPNPDLISALRLTADKLQKGAPYQWGHMGSCNCGHLAQTLTRFTKAEIHQRALLSRSGDWHEQLIDYCPTSGLPLDDVIAELLAAGLDVDDLKHLERLSDPKILQQLPLAERHLRHNFRNDVVIYLKTWARLLEDQWAAKTKVPAMAPAGQLVEASPVRVSV